MMRETKPTLAVHKFSSCDGCQLALLNLGEALLELPNYLEIVHFAEAGPSDPTAHVDLALVEGSISTPEDIERIRQVRKNSDYLISIGACATAGGIQALRNLADGAAWMAATLSPPRTDRDPAGVRCHRCTCQSGPGVAGLPGQFKPAAARPGGTC